MGDRVITVTTAAKGGNDCHGPVGCRWTQQACCHARPLLSTGSASDPCWTPVEAESGGAQIGCAHRVWVSGCDSCRATGVGGQPKPVVEQARLSALPSMSAHRGRPAEHRDTAMDRHRRSRDRNIMIEDQESLHHRDSMFGRDECRDSPVDLITSQQDLQKICLVHANVDHLESSARSRDRRASGKRSHSQSAIVSAHEARREQLRVRYTPRRARADHHRPHPAPDRRVDEIHRCRQIRRRDPSHRRQEAQRRIGRQHGQQARLFPYPKTSRHTRARSRRTSHLCPAVKRTLRAAHIRGHNTMIAHLSCGVERSLVNSTPQSHGRVPMPEGW
jgi:hypothetical protein